MRFVDIEVDKSEIAQSELNIDNKIRTNVFSWNGQFSPQFVEVLIRTYASAGDRILDPFLGSGTTVCECARQGFSALGIELNASAYHISKLYEMCNLTFAERLDILWRVDKLLLATTDMQRLSELATAENKTHFSNILSALVVLLDVRFNQPGRNFVLRKWEKLRETIIDLPYSKKPVSVILGDSNSVDIPLNSVHLLITSPPYINVFNYHQKYRHSVELLGYNVLHIAPGEIGANRKNRGNRLLTVIQYCIDMAISLRSSCKACRYNARMIYVVGRESNVLGYSFCNSELIYRIGTEVLGLQFRLRQERVFKNRYGQLIFEDILHFSNTKAGAGIPEQAIIEAARKIAVEALAEKQRSYPKGENTRYILDAIHKAASVKRSEAQYE